jgi:hypothetical protein
MADQVTQETQPDPIRAGKRKQMEAENKEQESQSQAALGRVSPRAVIANRQGRIPMGRVVTIPCPQYPEVEDEEGNVHPELRVKFRTDIPQRNNELKMTIEELVTVKRQEGESQQAYEARCKEALGPKARSYWLRKLAGRVIGFEGWDLLRKNEDGTVEPIPVPNPLDPESYLPLLLTTSDLADLGSWCLNEGWNEALEKSAGN